MDPLLDPTNVGATPFHDDTQSLMLNFMPVSGGDEMLTGVNPLNSQGGFYYGSPNPTHNNFAIANNEHDIYQKSSQYSTTSHESPMEYIAETKRPVAQDMLFTSKESNHQSYYTPFKYNTINVYAKYLTHGNNGKCYNKKGGQLSLDDVKKSAKEAADTVDWYESTVRENAIATKRRLPYIPNGVLDSKLFEYASAILMKRKCLSKMDVITIMPKVDVSSLVSRYSMPACQSVAKIRCDPNARYRSIDGSCNNLKMKGWGKSFTCHRRLLPPDYADGVSVPRIAYDGGKLPNAREISSLLLPDMSVQDHKLTSMTMAFGQFIIHDITRTLPTSNDIKCCPSKQAKHPECFAIDITRYDDVLVKAFNQTCINFVRSITCNPCSMGPREQQNQATHTFDMSHQYGLRLNDSLALRTMKRGMLRSSFTSTYPKEELPPKMTKEDPGCNVRPKPPRFKCFESADGVRASQHPGLQALHTAFHRRHNQHAIALSKVNPHWDDEKLYQEARRITIAEQSNMIYGEYLPAVFGKKLMAHFRLNVEYGGYTKYDPKLNPATIQEFIVAAGRFGHSQINDQFRVLFSDKKMSYSFSLRDNFFETTIVSLGHSGGVLKGLSLDPTEASDPYFVDDIRNQLYHARKEKFGRDLPAFNIQRGREHGIPGYVFYLDFCFGFKVKGWADLITFIPKKQLKKIKTFYRHWKDIDLFVGGVSERLISGAAFGPTFACINGIQFYNFKYGDRFYFEHGYQAGSFTPAQLENIKRTSTVAQLICRTHPEITHMPQNVFIQGHYTHPCHTFGELNYALWAERKYKMKRKPMKKYKPKSVTGYKSGHSTPKRRPSTDYKMKKKQKYKEKYEEDPGFDHEQYFSKTYESGPLEEHDDMDDTAPPSKIFFDHQKSFAMKLQGQQPKLPMLSASASALTSSKPPNMNINSKPFSTKKTSTGISSATIIHHPHPHQSQQSKVSSNRVNTKLSVPIAVPPAIPSSVAAAASSINKNNIQFDSRRTSNLKSTFTFN
ncbi:hypothetical protein RDWZM_010431 [Blomia tropicalis]|uniref:Uncharacterized protein n=1 Tax=Blomia tropicalis TaxID=40697 RepID=A0A9Q0RIR6_BLOTA|nr:hypothetical protein RDWZM_010431 [Blomia tropicalis]